MVGKACCTVQCALHTASMESHKTLAVITDAAACQMVQTASPFPTLHANGWSPPFKSSLDRLKTHLSTVLILHHQWDTKDINLGLARKARWKGGMRERKLTNMRTTLKILPSHCWPEVNSTEVGWRTSFSLAKKFKCCETAAPMRQDQGYFIPKCHVNYKMGDR